MIPKILHFVWLGGNPLPQNIEGCLKSWKEKMPDYEIKYWTESDFDYSSNNYVSQAISVGKWAFASDYFRLYVLYHFGGVYMDTDVMVLKNFDFALNNRFFSAIESYPERIEKAIRKKYIDSKGNKIGSEPYVDGIQIQAAVMGAEKGHPFLKECMNYYESRDFLDEYGIPDTVMISPFIYANIALKYGFKFIDQEQQLSDGIMIYSSDVFAPYTCSVTEKSYAVHFCQGSWVVDERNMSNYGEDDIPSLKLLLRIIDGILYSNKVLKYNQLFEHVNDGMLVKFMYFLSQKNLLLYRLFLIRISYREGLKLAKKIRGGVCYYRKVHLNWIKRIKASFINILV